MKKIAVFALILLLAVPLCGRAEGLLGHEKLSLMDKSIHSPREFLRVIKTIQHYNPCYSDAEIADTISIVYYKLKPVRSSLSVYEVARELQRFCCSDNLEIALQIMAATYMTTQL